eukprot:TRINITY_DN35057_c0_g1_i1.p1 TRINITY_DN35057_c0_g1~~TRINITY_DN35057_c0_g1_i1.p1  ORF type:complete len:174 (-),score=55.91 TRINITY_DN35057_c0_g1_i1:88-609(-)
MEGSGTDEALMLHQDMRLITKNLSNPTKSRARGPSGRKPPKRKTWDDKRNESDQAEGKFNLKLVQRKGPFPNQNNDNLVVSNSENNLGKIDPADFDKVLFFCVPTISYSELKEHPEMNHEKVENNNTSSIKIIKEIPLQSENNNVIEGEKETDSDLVKGKSKKLKPWKTCEIL